MRTLAKSLLLLLVCAAVSGCGVVRVTAGKLPLYVIDKQDIYVLPKGTIVTIPPGSTFLNEKKEVKSSWPNGETFTYDRQGFLVSQFYLNEVLDAQADYKKKAA